MTLASTMSHLLRPYWERNACMNLLNVQLWELMEKLLVTLHFYEHALWLCDAVGYKASVWGCGFESRWLQKLAVCKKHGACKARNKQLPWKIHWILKVMEAATNLCFVFANMPQLRSNYAITCTHVAANPTTTPHTWSGPISILNIASSSPDSNSYLCYCSVLFIYLCLCVCSQRKNELMKWPL